MSGILFVGDIHLGRRPGRVESALQALGLSSREVSAAAAWNACVEHAVQRGVTAVVLAGDVVDVPQDRFEAYGLLEAGVRRLAEAGIQVLGVAGNHDSLVLPRLAARIQAFRLLGRDGTWERVEFETGQGPVDVLGWSFPGASFPKNPLYEPSFDKAVRSRRPEALLVGILHADLDSRGSPHAPLPRRALESSDVSAWFLGHIHKPDDLTGARPIGYLGSLVGLDPGEPGQHGAWEVEIGNGVRAQMVPLAPIRWERLDVVLTEPVAGDGDRVYADPPSLDADAVQQRIVDAVQARMGDGSYEDPRLRVTAWRLRLTGRVDTKSRRAVIELQNRWRGEASISEFGGRSWFVERLVDATTPAVDLASLAQQRTPLGSVARRLLELESGGGDELVRKAEQVITGFHQKWGVEAVDRSDAREALCRATRRTLDILLEQVEADPGTEVA